MAKDNKLTKILSENEARMTAEALREFLVSEFPNIPSMHLSLAEKVVRMMSLNSRVKEARESMKLSIKEVASRLKVPQYRLKAIEKGTGLEIKPDVFWKYCEFLDLQDFVEEWIAANRSFANELGLISSEEDL